MLQERPPIEQVSRDNISYADYETRLQKYFFLDPRQFYVKAPAGEKWTDACLNTAVQFACLYDKAVKNSSEKNGMFTTLWSAEQAANVRTAYMDAIDEVERRSHDRPSVYLTPLSGAGPFLDGLQEGVEKDRLIPLRIASSAGMTSGRIRSDEGFPDMAKRRGFRKRVVEDILDTGGMLQHIVQENLSGAGLLYDRALATAQNDNRALNAARVPYTDQRFQDIYALTAEAMQEADVVFWAMINKNEPLAEQLRNHVHRVLVGDPTNSWAQEQQAALGAMTPMDPDTWIVGAGMFDMGVQGKGLLDQMPPGNAQRAMARGGLAHMTLRLYAHTDQLYGFDYRTKGNQERYLQHVADQLHNFVEPPSVSARNGS